MIPGGIGPADFSEVLPSGNGGIMYDAFKAMGGGMMKAGNSMLKMAVSFWGMCCEAGVKYLKVNPKGTNAYTTVSGTIFSVFLAIAASLIVFFFLLGWLNETIDINKSFTLENMFRFFVRFAIASSLVANSFWLVYGITDCSVALVNAVNVDVSSMTKNALKEEVLIDVGGMTKKQKKQAVKQAQKVAGEYGYFGNIYHQLDSNDDTEAWDWFSDGLLCFFGGLIGGLTILVCGVQLVVAVMQRLFRMLLCIPFAPIALSGLAGGERFSHSAHAWIRTFIGYGLEAVTMVLAIAISFGLFKDANLFASVGNGTASDIILSVCGMVMPMISACAAIKGSDMIVRRCMGLG